MENTMGKRISELRKKKAVTQEELAEHMGVTSQAVSKWETDIACPDISALLQLADYLGTNVDELLRGNRNDSVRMVPVEDASDLNSKFLRIIVDTEDGDRVRVNLPIPLVRVALEIGTQIPDLNGSDVLKKIDFNAILRLVDSGVMGKLIEVDSKDGDHVDVFVE